MNFLKKHRALLALNLALLLLALACVAGFAAVSGTLHHVDSAKNWRGENELLYSYISCFMPVDKKIDENAVYNFKNTVDQKMVEASLEAPEGAELWKFAYSGTAKVTAATNRNSAEVKAMGIGGDFFFFHRFFLCDGNYISGSDLMKDKVVIDKELAWTLFGATDVAGMEILINGGRYIVAGVIESDGDFASKAAKINGGGLYMAFEKLSEMNGAKIDCYEAVIPSPVKNFAINLVRENFPEKESEIIDAGKRYSAKNMLEVMASFGRRSMRVDGIIFPEWENAARLTEDYCAALLVLAAVFGITPVGFGAVLSYKYGKMGLAKLWEFTKEKAVALYDGYNDRIYEKNQQKKK